MARSEQRNKAGTIGDRGWMQRGDVIKALIMLVTTLVAALTAAYTASDSIATDTVKTIMGNEKKIEVLRKEYDNHIENSKTIEDLKDQNVQLQINNIEDDVNNIKSDIKMLKDNSTAIKELLLKMQNGK